MVAYTLKITREGSRFACPRHPLRSPLALAIEEAMPGRLEAVCVEEAYLTPDIEIKLPADIRLFERIFDRTGVCFPYTARLEIPDASDYESRISGEGFSQGTITIETADRKAQPA